MNRLSIFTLCCILLSGCSGDKKDDKNGKDGQADEGGAHEKIVGDMVKALDDLADALESVKDKESAKTAATQINSICDRLDKLGNEATKLGKASAEVNKKLEEKYKPELTRVMGRFQKSAFDAGVKSQGEPTFVNALKRLEQVGKTLGKIGGGS